MVVNSSCSLQLQPPSIEIHRELAQNSWIVKEENALRVTKQAGNKTRLRNEWISIRVKSQRTCKTDFFSNLAVLTILQSLNLFLINTTSWDTILLWIQNPTFREESDLRSQHPTSSPCCLRCISPQTARTSQAHLQVDLTPYIGVLTGSSWFYH